MIIGIDLGTTNSLVGIWRDDHAELIPNALGSFLTPSVVSVDDDENTWSARRRRSGWSRIPDGRRRLSSVTWEATA
ncbi:MAG: Hsp70 family protein [Candidatus Accumulibacter sp.]|jgi:molecular chaperone HscC|nr:Hsp70 family protein [Accumulibacter sp.]